MDKNGLSQKEFSEQTGISQSTISDWKRKKTNPSADKILKICEVLHINKHIHGYDADDTLAYIQDIENKRCYLINIEGLEKID